MTDEPPRDAKPIEPARLRVAHFFLVTAILAALYAAGAGSFQHGQPIALLTVLDELSVFAWAVSLACFLAVGWEAVRGRARLCVVDGLVAAPWAVFSGRGVDVALTISVMDATGLNFSIHEYYTLATGVAGIGLLVWLCLRSNEGLAWLWRAVLGLIIACAAVNLVRLGYMWASGRSEAVFNTLVAIERPRGAALLVMIAAAAIAQWRLPTRLGELRWVAIATALAVCALMAAYSYQFRL